MTTILRNCRNCRVIAAIFGIAGIAAAMAGLHTARNCRTVTPRLPSSEHFRGKEGESTGEPLKREKWGNLTFLPTEMLGQIIFHFRKFPSQRDFANRVMATSSAQTFFSSSACPAFLSSVCPALSSSAFPALSSLSCLALS